MKAVNKVAGARIIPLTVAEETESDGAAVGHDQAPVGGGQGGDPGLVGGDIGVQAAVAHGDQAGEVHGDQAAGGHGGQAGEVHDDQGMEALADIQLGD